MKTTVRSDGSILGRWLANYHIRFLQIIIASSLAWFPSSELRADPGYKVRAGKISFKVDSNVAFLKVSGSSSDVKGGGEGNIAGNVARVGNARFELDPKTLKTGMGLRDQHMYEQVFTAPDGSVPPVVLKTGAFQAELNPQTSKWEANFQGQLTLRGVTKPVRFHGSAEREGSSVIIRAEGTVRTSEFGVKPISYSGATVNDEVAVTVSDLRIEP